MKFHINVAIREVPACRACCPGGKGCATRKGGSPAPGSIPDAIGQLKKLELNPVAPTSDVDDGKKSMVDSAFKCLIK